MKIHFIFAIFFLTIFCSVDRGDESAFAPKILRVYGDGSTAATFFNNLMVEGQNFSEECLVRLNIQGSSSFIELVVTYMDASLLKLTLPSSIAEGAYELTVSNNLGEDSTVITLQKGDSGATGATGSTGTSGMPGDDGTPGETGPEGENGSDGNTGPSGGEGPCVNNHPPEILSFIATGSSIQAGKQNQFAITANGNDPSETLQYSIAGPGLFFLNATTANPLFDFIPTMAGGPFQYTALVSDGCQTIAQDLEIPYIKPGWVSVAPNNGSGVSPSIYYDNFVKTLSFYVYNQFPFLAFQDTSCSSGPKISVMAYGWNNIAGWSQVGSPCFATGNGYDISLFVYNGMPFIAFANWICGDDNATVMGFQWNGSNDWSNVGNSCFSPSQVSFINLFIDKRTFYVSYRNDDSPPYPKIVKRLNGSHIWEDVGTPATSEGQAMHPSLFIVNGTPFVAYSDDANSWKVTVMGYKWNGSSGWDYVANRSASEQQGNNISLYIDQGWFYISYLDNENGLSVRRYKPGVTSNWEYVGNRRFSTGVTKHTSLFVYKGVPFVSFQDPLVAKKTTVMMFDGHDWVHLGDPGISDGDVQYPSMFVSQGTPYVAYSDNGHFWSAVIKKYVPDPNDWIE